MQILPKRNRMEMLEKFRELALKGGGEEGIRKQHRRGKLTARERLDLLFDDGYLELGMYVLHRGMAFDLESRRAFGDGVITALGKVDGRDVVAIAQDFTFMGGSLGEMHAYKIVNAMRVALKIGAPVVFLGDSGGARIQEGVDALKGYGEIFRLNSLASGRIPQIAVIMGPCAGGAAYSPALMDLIIMVKRAGYMFVTGPKVVKAAIGEDVDEIMLGGADVHFRKSGVAHFVVEDDAQAIGLVKKLLSYLPSNNKETPPYKAPDDEPTREEEALDTMVPEDGRKPFDMYRVIDTVFDRGSFLEVHAKWARNVIVGFARLNGHVVGVVANQPAWMAGVLDIDSSDKIARFVRFCDAFNIPIVTLVDTPGYMPGTRQEHGGIIRHGAKVLYTYSRATVPRVTVIVRKAYGGAYIAMCSKHLGADVVFAWPQAEIAVMGPEGAAQILLDKKLRDVRSAEERSRMLEDFVKEYREKFTNPFVAAARGYVDQVIEPKETRPMLIKALEPLLHGPYPKRQEGIMPV